MLGEMLDRLASALLFSMLENRSANDSLLILLSSLFHLCMVEADLSVIFIAEGTSLNSSRFSKGPLFEMLYFCSLKDSRTKSNFMLIGTKSNNHKILSLTTEIFFLGCYHICLFMYVSLSLGKSEV